MSQASNSKRIKVIAAAAVLASLILVARLYYVQIVHGSDYQDEANAQYTQSSNQVFNRGSISFTARDGTNRVAALQESGYTLAVNARFISDAGAVHDSLAEIVDIDEAAFMEDVSDSNDPYIVIAEQISTEQARAIRALDIEGVGAYPEKWRRYPYGSLASHVLGYVGFGESGDERTGIYGIERYYNDILDRDSNGLYTNFFAQVFSGIGSALTGDVISRDGDIVLTIEPDVQSYLEQVLVDTAEEWDTEQMMGIVIDPNNGEIKAMAVNPTYDPNDYGAAESVSTYTNPLVQSRYEMGSIIKALTVAAGLDAGVITPETMYEDKGSIELSGYTISNYDGRARGEVNMQEVLNQSLNTGASFIAQELGQERMREYFYGFGLNEKTDIKLPGEVGNAVSNLEVDRELAFATASFGQGIALTPISTVRALSALANGGRLVQPHVVKSIDWRLGGSSDVTPDNGRQVLKPETSEEISRMLVNVTDEALAGGGHARDRHSIGVKTGTAQIAQPGGGYYDNLFNHTYFGYFPAYEPEFLVFLMAREPEGARYASETLTEPFFELADFLLNYYNVSPDR